MQNMRSGKREVCMVISGSSYYNNKLEIKAIGGRWEEGGKILSQNHRFANANRGFGSNREGAWQVILQYVVGAPLPK